MRTNFSTPIIIKSRALIRLCNFENQKGTSFHLPIFLFSDICIPDSFRFKCLLSCFTDNFFFPFESINIHTINTDKYIKTFLLPLSSIARARFRTARIKSVRMSDGKGKIYLFLLSLTRFVLWPISPYRRKLFDVLPASIHIRPHICY